MPDRGQRKLTDDTAPVTDSDSWTLTDARWLQVTFEAARDSVLAALPCEVTRTVPCYARLFVVEAGGSPAGPVQLAALLAGGRYMLQPRNIVARGVVDGERDAVAAAFGPAFGPGSVTLSRDGARVTAAIDGDVTVELPSLRAIDRTMLRWDPWIGVAGIEGEPRMFECALEPVIDRAFLTKSATLASSGERGSVWQQFRCLNMVSACYAEGTLVFGKRQACAPAAE